MVAFCAATGGVRLHSHIETRVSEILIKFKKTSEENKQKYGLIKPALIFTMAAY